MKKLLIIVASLLVASFAYAQDLGLINYVPKDADGFLYLNISDIVSHPKARELMESSGKDGENKEFVEMKKEFQANGLDIYKSFQTAVAFFGGKGGDEGGLVVKTSVNEATMNKILGNIKSIDGRFKSSMEEGTVIYCIEGNGSNNAAAQNPLQSAMTPGASETLYFAYSTPDTVVFCDKKEKIPKMISDGGRPAGSLKLMNLASKVDKSSTAWGVYQVRQKDKPAQSENAQPEQEMMPFDNVQGGAMALKLTGEKRETIELKLDMACREKAKAQMLTIQLQAMAMMMIPQMAQGDVQLADELTKAIKFSNEENDVVIGVEITPSIQDRLKKLSERRAQPGQPGVEVQDKAATTEPAQEKKAAENQPEKPASIQN